MKVGITGHQRLQDDTAWNWVERSMLRSLADLGPSLIGISSLAIGADQLFARLVLKLGGALHVVLPFKGYEKKLDSELSRDSFLTLLSQASKLEILEAHLNEEESYLMAGKRVVDLADLMVAVWNGKRAAGPGGTGDVVRYAQETGKKVIHINPATREILIREGRRS